MCGGLFHVRPAGRTHLKMKVQPFHLARSAKVEPRVGNLISDHLPFLLTTYVHRTARKNLIVDGAKVKRLQLALKVPSKSEAVRVAIDRALRGEEAVAAIKRLRERGTWGQKIAD